MPAFSAPVRVSLDITYACDLRCIHCRTNTGEIPPEILRHMLSIDQLKELVLELDEMNVFEITFTGGEPTIRKGFWDLIGVVPQLKYSTVTLITNAANLTRDQMDCIIDNGIQSIRVSMDGTRETFAEIRKSDVFDQVIENSKYLRDRVSSFKVLTTAMTTNLATIFDLVSLLRQEGFLRQDLILVRAHGRGGRNRLLLTEQETMDLYYQTQAFRQRVPAVDFDLRLNAPYLIPGEPIPKVQDVVMYPYLVKNTSVAISATGDVTMSRLYSPHPIGNVKHKSMRMIWDEGQNQLDEEQETFSDDRLREIFWSFAAQDHEEDLQLTSLLDRQIFEDYEVR